MQIHIEAHLILNISVSISESAMKMFPLLTSCRSLLLFSSGQCRMESLGPKLSRCALKSEFDEGGLVLLEIQNRSTHDTARECCSPPSFSWKAGQWLFLTCIWLVTDLLTYLSTMKPQSPWTPNYWLGLNFVLFLHQLGWSQRLVCFNTWSRPKITASRMCFSGV